MSAWEGSTFQDAMKQTERRIDITPKTEAQIFGSNLREILFFLEINQSELAAKSGLTQAAISQIINGERAPSLRTILKILKALPVSFERLMSGYDLQQITPEAPDNV